MRASIRLLAVPPLHVGQHGGGRPRASSSVPTVGNWAANASASSKVDFPEPFSPTKKVTGLLRSTVPRDRITGTVKGNRPRSDARVDLGAKLSKCGMT